MPSLLSLIFTGVCGYLLGSIPTAYLLVRWKSRIDIRTAGSGNVGTLNSYEVSKSRSVGLAVLLIDLLKGAAAVFVGLAFGHDFLHAACGAVGAVIGHNFPVWLAFHGGRGLAPAAGAVLIIGWPLVASWCVFWALGFFVTRHVNMGNAIACIVAFLAMVLIPLQLIHHVVPLRPTRLEFAVFAVLLFSVILVKHVEPVREYLQLRKGEQ